MAEKSDPDSKLIAENRRARFDYYIESDLEAGIMLAGSEVKSLRQGGSNIAESYASVEGGELWLINSYIAPYAQAKLSRTKNAGGASFWSTRKSCPACGTPLAAKA